MPGTMVRFMTSQGAIQQDKAFVWMEDELAEQLIKDGWVEGALVKLDTSHNSLLRNADIFEKGSKQYLVVSVTTVEEEVKEFIVFTLQEQRYH